MPESPPTTGHHAVFLSYAREDTDAARRIADALRAFGVEVWFDQSELRGGDQWDAKIRKQIRECTLFLPLVSQRTQERAEGYFRREWKLAVERTHDMAAGVAFIVPVAIDETPERDAAVPEEFLRYQWTHLAHGVPTPQFVEQVKRLLEAPRKATPAMEAGRPRPAQRDGDVVPTAEVGRALRARLGWIAGSAAVLILVGIFGWRSLHQASDAVPPSEPAARRSAPPTSEKPVRPAHDPLRIAVLPLTNISPDASDEYLAVGMTEELTSSLSKISGLEVIARTSSEQAKKAGKSLSEIGAELRVGTLLEGSVSKAGDQLRISVQLIDVATQRFLWSEIYNTELKDVFKMRSDVAGHVVEALKVKLLGSEVQRLKQEPTASMAAYELYLKGRFHYFKYRQESFIKAREYFMQALAIDPNYALAYCGLVDAFRGDVATSPREARPAVEKAARRAIELDDALAEAHLSMGIFKFYFDWNWAAAETEFKRAISLKPNLAMAHQAYAVFLMVMGRFEAAIAEQKKAVNLDPTSAAMMSDLGFMYSEARKYDEAIAWLHKAIELDANFEEAHRMEGWTYLFQGKLAEALLAFQKAVALERNPWTIAFVGAGYAIAGRPDDARRAIDELNELSKSRYVSPILSAWIHIRLGEKERMFELLEKAYVENSPSCVYLNIDETWDRVRPDPRFQALLKKIGFVK